ncbi:ABC transporter permease [Solimonas sp. K1W22B-7]|uniref:ABC transporter permease n=1 Tax=Solimonas sp. K1W22B-7 TaxID=2303331 RepID=UPI000E3379E6|nr:ABC transporter permease [Solimonas sp. K1W22B-7]AXQ27910.1 ABC transporter permease [Solimonas sp. K1W22B-7]
MKYFPLIWSALWRKKPRTIYTMLSIVVAFLLFGMLQAVAVGMTKSIEISGADRLFTAGKFSFTEILPIGYYARIKSVPGVTLVSHANWFGGVYQDEKNFFAQFAVDHETYLEMYPEFIVSDEAKALWARTRTGALVGVGLARKFGWKIGDRVPVQAAIWPKRDGRNDWQFDIVGFIDTKDEATRNQTEMMLFRFDYFDEARQFGQGYTGWYLEKVADPAQAGSVAAAIDRQFANSPKETRTDSEKAFNQSFMKQMGDIQLIIQSILGAVFFTLLFLTGNTMMQSVRERIPELAVLKTIGFSDRSVLGLVLTESLLLCLIAALVGLGVATLLMPGLAAKVPGLRMEPEVWFMGVGVAVALAVVVGFPPAWRAMRLDIVNALAGH